jgi:hypothetical protein
MWPLSFWICLTSLNMTISSSIHFPNFILLYGWIILHCIYMPPFLFFCKNLFLNFFIVWDHIFLIHSSVIEHLGCFHNLTSILVF